MITSEQYISQTEHAVKSMFESISHYSELIKMSFPPVKAFRHGGEKGEFERMYSEWRSQPEIKQEFELAEHAREEYRASLFSMHVISGSIIQIACKAIELYSNNTSCEPELDYLFEGCSQNLKFRLAKFAIGRKVRGVPIGLIVHAGRNQYNHFEEQGKLKNAVNNNVFRALAMNHDYGDFPDPPFDIENESIVSFSSNIRSLLGWDSYEKYVSDIQELIVNRTNA